MPLILRNVKGSSLTYTEMDNNLLYLENLASSGGAGNKKTIPYGETFTIPEYYQNFIYGDFIVEGTLNNYGEVAIAN